MSELNHFLRSLSPAEDALIRGRLAAVKIVQNERISEPGDNLRFVVFPTSCVLSIVTVMKDGRAVESRTIGRESAYGLLHALGSRLSSERVFAQVPGEAWRVPIGVLEAAAKEAPSLVPKIVQHAQVTIIQASQATACNLLHAAEHRLAKWLLLTQDRLGGDLLALTQEHLAIMLGVQRTTVTEVAGRLRARGWIRQARGKIQILNRPALIACACECYETIETLVEEMAAPRVRQA